jgi:putative ABC transport system permease protein
LSPGAERRTVEAAIERELGQEQRLQVRSGTELIAYFAGQARQGFRFLYVMEGITLLLVLVGISDTLATSVVERTRTFGVMRAVGLRRSQLIGMVLLEGGAIGLLGLLLALATGVALGTFWVQVQFPALVGWALDLHFPYWFVLVAATLTLVLCLVASLLPAIRASQLLVTTALCVE